MRKTLFFSFSLLAASGLIACGASSIDARDGGSDDSGGGTDGTVDAHLDGSGEAGDSATDTGVADAGATDADAGPDGAIDLDGGNPCDGWVWDGGPPCYANSDCKGGTCAYEQTVCTFDGTHTIYTTTSACPGVCLPYAEGDGGFCSTPSPVCDPDSGLTCDPFSHRCVPPASAVLPVVDAGARCGLGVANCEPGFFCAAPTFPDNGVCEPVIADGGACDPGNLFGGCADGLACAGYGTSLDAGVCRPPSPTGGACVTGTGVGSSGCEPSALCVDGGCVPLPSTGACLEGECDPDAGYCASTGTCTAWQSNGAACTAASECKSGLCASTSNTCVAELPLGAACGSLPYDCTGGLCVGDAPGCASGICDMTGHCAVAMCARVGDAGGN